MFNLKSLLRNCCAAAVLAGASLGAMATPVTYHVAIDTSTLSGDGLLTLSFVQNGNAGPVVATVTKLTGLVSGVTATGDVTADADSLTIGNAIGDNFIDLNATFGGEFGFDLMFSEGYLNETASAFSSLYVFLTDTDYVNLAGDLSTGLGHFDITGGSRIITVINAPSLLTVEVPEPSELLLVLTALAAMGVTMRRRAVR
ncbi:MAG: hypothetical protein JWP59_2674 [Massilia sp.]|jgi:hypothetical protein|nr:hypothetical protein [Massilia sp.]